MKIKKCPVCKSPLPRKAESCPMCMKTFSKLQLFRMYWLKRTVWLLIVIILFYNSIVVILENKKIRMYLENPPKDMEKIEQLEREYELLNPLQKYFVHKSEIEYLKKQAQMHTEREIVDGEYVTVYFQHGSVKGEYTGEVTDGIPNGSGNFAYTNENGEKCVYEGEFSEAKIEGNGVLEFEDGIKYAGDFHDGALNGYAKIYNSYGNLTAKGQFVNDELFGEGTIYDGNGNEIYSGNFKNGVPEKFSYMEACEDDDIVNISRNGKEKINKNVCVSGVVAEVISEDGKVEYKVYDLVSNFSIMVKSREKRPHYEVDDKVYIYGYCTDIDDELNKGDIYINSFYIEDADDIINQ